MATWMSVDIGSGNGNTWTNIDSSALRYTDIHLRANSQKITLADLKIYYLNISFKPSRGQSVKRMKNYKITVNEQRNKGRDGSHTDMKMSWHENDFRMIDSLRGHTTCHRWNVERFLSLLHVIIYIYIFQQVATYDDAIKWKHFPCYWPFVRGFHRSPMNSHQKDQWRKALIYSSICAWTNGWVNNREAGD